MPRSEHAFPRHNRLDEPNQYDRVFAGRQRLERAGIVLFVLPNPGPHPRLGLAIGLRASRKAVVRNRLKRLARETFRRLKPGLGPMDFVVSVGTPVSRAGQQAFATHLTALFERTRACAPR